MSKPRITATAGCIIVALLALGGCADGGSADLPGDLPTASASPTPDETPVSSAALDSLAAFMAAAKGLDADIAATGILVNGLFVTDGVRYVDSVQVATLETTNEVEDAAALIPAGLEEDVRVAAVQVYQDLLNRAYTLAYIPHFIGNGLYAIEHPGEVWTPAQDAQELADQARALLAYGGISKERYADDLLALQRSAAASDEPAAPVAPDSMAAGLLAFEIASVNIGIQGCHPMPGTPPAVTSRLLEWQSVEIGPFQDGSAAIQAHYDPVEGWQIRFPYC